MILNTRRGQQTARHLVLLVLAHTLLPALAAAQSDASSPVRAMRNKISAGDLRSAESILEVHRQTHGDGDQALVGLSWLARGALLLDEPERGCRYANDVRATVSERRDTGTKLLDSRALRTAYGAATEVRAQCLLRSDGAGAARRFLEQEIAGLNPVLVAERSRLNKRLNLFTLAGTPAPDVVAEDWVGEKPPSLSSLQGQPVVLFMWAEWCGDCKAQAALLAHARNTFEQRGVRFLTVTRYYDEPDQQAGEKSEIERVWNQHYAEAGDLPIAISTAAMERYGVSSTPTWVFVDRAGVVYDYAPVRLTTEELERRVEAVLQQ